MDWLSLCLQISINLRIYHGSNSNCLKFAKNNKIAWLRNKCRFNFDYLRTTIYRGVITKKFRWGTANGWVYYLPPPDWERVNIFENLGKAASLITPLNIVVLEISNVWVTLMVYFINRNSYLRDLYKMTLINPVLLKINLPKFRFMESLRHTAILKNLNFCANSARSKTWSRKNISWTEMKILLTKPSNVLPF